MPSWRPAEASDPDDENEWRFEALEEHDADLATVLLDAYGRRWLELAGLTPERLPEVPDTVELVVADDWTEPPASGLRVLRLRSWYTGSTYWLWDWDGARDLAARWIEDVAELQASNVTVARQRYGETPWDR